MATLKTSYTIVCSSEFRDAISAIADKRGVNVADLARSVLLVTPLEQIAALPDPGGPMGDDRETVILKSGKFAGRPWRRKPRLQLRLPPGLSPENVRKALNLILLFERGAKEIQVSDTAPLRVCQVPPPPRTQKDGDHLDSLGKARLAHLEEETERLKSIMEVLSFEPLPSGVGSRGEALYVLGFPPYADPDSRELRARFRLLATIHHPDSSYGDHRRMSQLNEAMEYLRKIG